MSCCGPCLKIQILKDYPAVPDHFLTGGKLYLDVSTDFALEFSKALGELTELNEISDEGVLSVSLPYTPKNKFVSDFVRNHNRTENDYSPLPVLIQEGPVIHRISELTFTGSNDEDKTLEAEFSRGAGHWLTASRDLYLRGADLGEFELNEANIRDNWQNNSSYSDGGTPVYFPLCFYGVWTAQNEMKVADFRPWFHLLGLLQKGFCATGGGWSFRSPWLESAKGRKLGCYLAGKDYGADEQYLPEKKFLAKVLIDGVVPITPLVEEGNTIPVLVFDEVELNPNGYYNPDTGKFSGGMVIADFVANIYCQFEATAYDRQFVVRVMRENPDGTIEEIEAKEGNISPNSGTSASLNFPQANISVRAKNVYVPEGASVYIALSFQLFPRYIEGTFYNEPRKVIYQSGDTIPLNIAVRNDLTLLDFFKGVASLVNGKIRTDWESRTVWLYTPYEREYYDETIEGFYTNDIEDWTPLIVQSSEAITIERLGIQRYALLRFQDGNDAEIKAQGLEDESPLYSRLIDFGPVTKNEDVNEIKNPLFEPTINSEIQKFGAIPPETEFYNVSIPHVLDNEEGRLSFDLGARLVEFAGYVSTRKTDVPFSPLRRWIFEGTTENRLPFAYQQLPSDTDIQIGLLPQPKQGGPVFADHANDFYQIGWKEELSARLESVRSSFQVVLPALAYKALDFRKWARIYYNGRTFFARLLEVSGRQACSSEPCIAIFRPDRFAPECVDVSIIPTIVKCSDAPGISVNIDVPGDTITADVNNEFVSAPIIADGLEYSTDQGQTWQGYQAQDSIVAQSQVVFRRSTDLESCGPVETVRTVNFRDYCANSFIIDIVHNERANTASATATDRFNSPVDTDTWTVSIDAGDPVPYTAGDEISEFGTVEFYRKVTFTNSCPDVEVYESVEAENGTGGNCYNTIDIAFSEVAPCVYLPEIAGSYSSPICSTTWEVSKDNGTTWGSWDFAPIKSEAGTKVRVAVQFCDYCPPRYVEKACPF